MPESPSDVQPGTFWWQPRGGRRFAVVKVGEDSAECLRQTRGGNWPTKTVTVPLADFLGSDEDPLLDNLMGWRLERGR